MSKKSLVLLSLVLSSCASTPKFDLTEEMKKEVEVLKLRDAKSSDGYFSFKAEGKKDAEITLVEQSGMSVYYTKIDVGPIIECYIYKAPVLSSSTLVNLQKVAVPNAVEKETSLIDVGVIKGLPFIRLDTLLSIDSNEGRVAGYLKIASTTKNPNSIVCLNLNVGYKKTFQRVFEQVVSSFTSQDIEGTDKVFKKKYQEVHKLAVKGDSVGFVSTDVYNGEEGAKILSSTTTILMRQSPSEVVAIDEMVAEISDKKGNIISRTSQGVAGGAQTQQLQLKNIDGKKYSVEGQFQGKEISSELDTASGIMSAYQIGKIVKEKIVTGKEKSLTFVGYNPQLSPVKLLPATYSVKALTKNSTTVKTEMSGVEVSVDYNKDGSVKEMTIPAGPLKIIGTGMYKNGSY